MKLFSTLEFVIFIICEIYIMSTKAANKRIHMLPLSAQMYRPFRTVSKRNYMPAQTDNQKNYMEIRPDNEEYYIPKKVPYKPNYQQVQGTWKENEETVKQNERALQKSHRQHDMPSREWKKQHGVLFQLSNNQNCRSLQESSKLYDLPEQANNIKRGFPIQTVTKQNHLPLEISRRGEYFRKKLKRRHYQPLKPVHRYTPKRSANLEANSIACLTGNCEAPEKKKPITSSALVQKAAEEAKAAVDSQQIIAEKAANQLKIQFAQKAETAAQTAEAAVLGKEAILNQLTEEIEQGTSIAKEENKEMPIVQQYLQQATKALQIATQEENALQGHIQFTQRLASQAEAAAHGAQAELADKEKFIEEIKNKDEALNRVIASAQAELAKTKEAEQKAAQAATSAKGNAGRNQKQKRSSRYTEIYEEYFT